ncbi:Homeodomain-like protein [Talaromyces proteolyticus]|uniref:Homeodomain-like protein n=1 Tax=Talaromyces proteolyticus TaxID=1131652 RepID=A0AAD4KZE6_9EURO|nr:Homeodomain-like protein [Talaromyces proteolyticus]KAH8700635.1 Homeodomain-like protein [Talaromyces proteolyticus]
MAPTHRRGPWVPEEDSTLMQLVHEQGPNNWVRISQQMQFRSPKQCRERFHQNLKPSLNHTPISAEEGLMIERMVNEMGKRWAEIARRLGNRSDNAVKNWWNGSMNRKRRGLVVQTGHPSRTCNGRIEAPYPRASDNIRRSSWSFKGHPDGSPVAVSHLIHERSDSPNNNRRYLAPVVTFSTRPVEPSMTSPAFSEVSTLDPPSLVSDHNSVSSASPRTLPSPQMLPLPVDVRQVYVERRCSVPTFLQHTNSSKEDIYVSSDPDANAVRKWESEYHSPQPFKPSGHHYSNSVPEATESHEDRRDSRMGLKSLLN